jgi:acetyl esterase
MTLESPVQDLLTKMRAGMQTQTPSVDDVPAMRAALSALIDWGRPVAGVSITDAIISGAPVRLYRPQTPGPHPLHVWLHGGAFMLGSAMSGEYDEMLTQRALNAGCLVASVEYRLAPEHRFPAGVEDCYRVLRDLVAGAPEFGIDTRAVTVGGGSSGGNFAAVLALMARDRGEPRIDLQLLEVAGTDLTKSSASWRNPRPEHDTTRERDLALIDLYLSSVAERAHPYASPIFAADLSGVAPAYVMNAEFDPRRDECEAYVTRLRDAGVPAIAAFMSGHIHGSMILRDWEPAREWRAQADTVLATANRAACAGWPVLAAFTAEPTTTPQSHL